MGVPTGKQLCVQLVTRNYSSLIVLQLATFSSSRN